MNPTLLTRCRHRTNNATTPTKLHTAIYPRHSGKWKCYTSTVGHATDDRWHTAGHV